MKLHTSCIAASVLAMAMGPAFAASTAQLKVTGTLVAPSCDITMPSGDTADFSNIVRGNLNPSTSTPLTTIKSLSVQVNCGAANTSIAIFTTDSMSASRPTDARSFAFADGTVSLNNTDYYGLGNASNSNPIGAYAVRVGKISMDGTEQASIQTSSDGVTWSTATGPTYFSNTAQYVSAGPAAMGKLFTFPLEVAANISATSTLPAGEVDLSGNATIEVKYL